MNDLALKRVDDLLASYLKINDKYDNFPMLKESIENVFSLNDEAFYKVRDPVWAAFTREYWASTGGYRPFYLSDVDLALTLCESSPLRGALQSELELQAGRFLRSLKHADKICPLVQGILRESRDQDVVIDLFYPNDDKYNPAVTPVLKLSKPLKVNLKFFSEFSDEWDPCESHVPHECTVCKSVYESYGIQKKLKLDFNEIESSREMNDRDVSFLEPNSMSLDTVWKSVTLPTYGFVFQFIDNMDLLPYLYDPLLRVPCWLQKDLQSHQVWLSHLYSPDNVLSMYPWFVSNPRKLPLRHLKNYSLALGRSLVNSRSPGSVPFNRKKFMKKGKKLLQGSVIFDMTGLSNFDAEGFRDFMKGAWAFVWQTVPATAGDCYEFLKRYFKKIFEKLEKVPEVVTNAIYGFLQPVAKWIWNVLNDYIFDTIGWKIFELVLKCTAEALVLFTIGSFLWRVCKSLIRFVFPGITENQVKSLKPGYQAEGLDLPIVSAVSLLSTIFGFSGGSRKEFKDICSTINTCVSAGKNLNTVISCSLLLLPAAITTSLAAHGMLHNPEALARETDSWKVRAQGLLACSQIAHVLNDPLYLNTVHRTMREVQPFLKRNDLHPMQRTQILGLWFKLQSIVLSLEQLESQKGERSFPYGLHLCGRAGVGKSELVSMLVRDAFRIDPRDTFNRPIDSEYWDGFSGQKAIIIDEFLVGDPKLKTDRAREYLGLVSCQRFAPNLASVDNPTVGIKGTLADPSVVVTMNNEPYDVAEWVRPDALQRRRKMVIELSLRPEFIDPLRPNQVNFANMERGDIRNAAWLQFRMLPAQRIADDRNVYPLVDYQEVIRTLRADYDRHRHIGLVLAEAMGRDLRQDLTAAQIIERVTRNAVGVAFGPMEEENLVRAEAPNPKGFDRRSNGLIKRNPTGRSLFSPLERKWHNIDASLKPEEQARRKRLEKQIFREVDRQNFSKGLWSLAVDRCAEYGQEGDLKSLDRSKNFGIQEADLQKFYTHTHRCCGIEYQHSLLFDTNMCELCHKTDPCHDCIGHVCYLEQWENGFRAMYETYDSGILKAAEARKKTRGQPYHGHKCNCGLRGKDTEHPCIGGKFYCPLGSKYPNCEDTEGITIYEPWAKRFWEAFTEEFILEEGPINLIFHNNPLNLDIAEFKAAAEEERRIKIVSLEQALEIKSDKDPISFYGLFDVRRLRDIGILGGVLLSGICLAGGFVMLYRGVSSALGRDPKECSVHDFTLNDYRAETSSSDDEYYARKPQLHKKVRGGFNNSWKNNWNRRDNRHWNGEGDFESQKGHIFSLQIKVDGVPVNMIPVQGHYFLSYYHGFKNCIPGKSVLTFDSGSRTYDTVYREECARYLPEADLICYNFYCPDFVSFPNCMHRFVPEADLMKIVRVQCVLHRMYDVEHVVAELCQNLNYTDGSDRFTLDHYFRYAGSTQKGDCGRPLVAINAHFNGKILGIHVAGTVNKDMPVGASTLITREIVLSLIAFEDNVDVIPEMVSEGLREATGPNLESIELVPIAEQFFCPTVTKYSPSAIAPYIERKTEKEPAILDRHDIRSRGRDPVEVSLEETFAVSHVRLDQEIVDQVTRELGEHIKRNMKMVVPFRRLTFEEACGGIPGVLRSLNMKTSPGYPLVLTRTKRGKVDSVWFDDGELNYTPQFKAQVEEKLKEIESYRPGDHIEHRFLGYLKDETLPLRKIEACKTRMIYCNDLIALVAFRMIYGATIANIYNSPRLSFALGQNPYSFDMDAIYSRLREKGDRFLDGDYKSWDKTVNPQLIEAAYSIFCSLNEGKTSNYDIDQYLYSHEVRSKCQIGRYLVRFKLTQVSGCFLTTIVNCIVNDLNFRYCFYKLDPSLNYDKHVDASYMGDDHLIGVSEAVKFTPVDIAQTLSDMGYTYTSAIKDQPLTTVWKDFGDCYFLGANIRQICGRYVGALNKTTLYESLLWTKDKNLSLLASVRTLFEMASLWDSTFFETYTKEISDAIERAGFGKQMIPPYSSTQREVCYRTGDSGHCYMWWAQGPETKVAGWEAEGPSNLTNLQVEQTIATTLESPRARTNKYVDHSVNESVYDLMTGLDSLILRKEVEWKPSDLVGTTLFEAAVPFDLLELGNQNNLQNMAFQRMMYFSSDVELTFLINGNPFSQGGLISYFLPLTGPSAVVNEKNLRMNSHVLLFPNVNTTATLMIPFIFYYNVMNTLSGESGIDTLGTLRVVVLSELKNASPAPVTVSIFTRFINPRFSLPRPLVTSEAPALTFQAEGNTSSSEVNNYVVNTNSVVGSMPLESGLSSTATQSVGTDLGLTIPMDNPPLVSGSIPVHQVFSGMSKTVGVEPTVAMQFHPQTMFREPYDFTAISESSFESIMGKTGIMSRATWKSTDPPGTALWDINLNSFLGMGDGMDFSESRFIPANIAILNYFDIWRADLEFEIMAFKNSFQSGRLLVSVAYGAPSFESTDRNVFKNHLLDFSKESMTKTWVVPYNASSEYLRTWAGNGAYLSQLTTSMGRMKIFVNNQLQGSTETVSDSIELILSVRFRKPQFVEFKSNPLVDGLQSRAASSRFQAEGLNDLETAVACSLPEDSVPTSMTDTMSNVQHAPLCRLDLGRKFEFIPRDIHEVVRRPRRIYYDEVFSSTDDPRTASTICTLIVRPRSELGMYFRAWSGHVKFRIFCNSAQVTSVFYYNPAPGSKGPLKYDLFARAGIPISDGTYTYTSQTPSVPTEVLYNVSTTQKYIDVSVPFNTVRMFMQNPITKETPGQFADVGRIAVVFRNPDPLSLYLSDEIYVSLGDDGRYMIPIFKESKIAVPDKSNVVGYGGYWP